MGRRRSRPAARRRDDAWPPPASRPPAHRRHPEEINDELFTLPRGTPRRATERRPRGDHPRAVHFGQINPRRPLPAPRTASTSVAAAQRPPFHRPGEITREQTPERQALAGPARPGRAHGRRHRRGRRTSRTGRVRLRLHDVHGRRRRRPAALGLLVDRRHQLQRAGRHASPRPVRACCATRVSSGTTGFTTSPTPSSRGPRTRRTSPSPPAPTSSTGRTWRP